MLMLPRNLEITPPAPAGAPGQSLGEQVALELARDAALQTWRRWCDEQQRIVHKAQEALAVATDPEASPGARKEALGRAMGYEEVLSRNLGDDRLEPAGPRQDVRQLFEQMAIGLPPAHLTAATHRLMRELTLPEGMLDLREEVEEAKAFVVAPGARPELDEDLAMENEWTRGPRPEGI